MNDIKTIESLTNTLLTKNSSNVQLESALDSFVTIAGRLTGIEPDKSFDAWSDDSFLDTGVAINPNAAAQCVKDYRRSVVFIRAVYQAIMDIIKATANQPIKLLYAGCGPYATLLMPLLGKLENVNLHITLLDIHQKSLDSVVILLDAFEISRTNIKLIHADATKYQPAEHQDIIVTEIMQKSLEQEPQFAVTANLANYLSANGVFIPELITTDLYFAHLEREKAQFGIAKQSNNKQLDHASRISLGNIFNLIPTLAPSQLKAATFNANLIQQEIILATVTLPEVDKNDSFDVVMYTRIKAYKDNWLNEYESEITLPYKFHEISDLSAGQKYQFSYVLGSYPKFHVTNVNA